MRFAAWRRYFRMRLAVTFRNQAEQERRDNEYRYSFLNRSEAKSLPHLIEFETPRLFNQVSNPSK
jgi:hypothetical protein